MVNFGRGFNFDHWSVLTRNIYNGIVKRYPFSKLIGFDKDNDPHPHILLLKSKFWLKQDKTNYRDALECREVSSTGTTTGHLQGLLLHYLQNFITLVLSEASRGLPGTCAPCRGGSVWRRVASRHPSASTPAWGCTRGRGSLGDTPCGSQTPATETRMC